jgi:adenylate kinase family enzyme
MVSRLWLYVPGQAGMMCPVNTGAPVTDDAVWGFDLRRVVVVGTSCSGKTTFARELASVLAVPHVELDALYWLPGWAERPVDEFRERVRREAMRDRWVADGNYSDVRCVLWPRATDVIWLDFPLALILARWLWRTIRHVVTRQQLFSGNRETIRSAFLSRDSLILYIVRTFGGRRARYSALQTADEWKHIRFSRFRSPADATRFLNRCSVVTCRSRW